MAPTPSFLNYVQPIISQAGPTATAAVQYVKAIPNSIPSVTELTQQMPEATALGKSVASGAASAYNTGISAVTTAGGAIATAAGGAWSTVKEYAGMGTDALGEKMDSIRIDSDKNVTAPARNQTTSGSKGNANHPKAETVNHGSIDFTPGMPPLNHLPETNQAIENSMPVVYIYPGELNFEKGIALVKRENKWSKYTTLLKDNGFTLNQPGALGDCIKLAYIADNFPTDSFTNNYGENFLQGMTDVAGDLGGGLSQTFGIRTAADAKAKMGKLADSMKGKAWGFGDMMAKGLETGIDLTSAGGDIIDDMVGGGAGIAASMVMGSRMDFPMLWKNSSFEPSYSMTIRLYNPNPGNKDTTNKYIIGPIAAIMLLGIPQASEKTEILYSWPFLHRIYSPGIFDLEPAYISNITIVKGGDQQQIAFTQKLSMVDVRIDFGSLYSSMIASNKTTDNTRPTLGKYLDAMRGGKTAIRHSTVGRTDSEKAQNAQNKTVSSVQPLTKTANFAPGVAAASEGVASRVSTDAQDKATSLMKQDTSNLYAENEAKILASWKNDPRRAALGMDFDKE